MKEATAFFRLLGDEARLRILRLLEKERLNVSELTSILGIAQPGVSRHLRLLKEGGLVQEERDRGWTYYGLAPSPDAPGRAWDLLRREIKDLPIEAGSMDVALLSQALHHAKDPAKAIAEASRILAPGGTLLLLDLKSHKEEWVKKLGDRWMGFDEETLRKMMRDAGLRE